MTPRYLFRPWRRLAALCYLLAGWAGAGVRIDTFSRRGDYSGMTVDPVDDCTFWYTQQYIANSGRFTWRSRIAAFRFRNCD